MPYPSSITSAGESGWIAYHARRRPAAVALIDDRTGRVVTYGQLDQRATAVAGHLHSQGVTAGSRVALLAQNSSNAFEVLEACARIRAILVPINWRLHEEELVGVLGDCEPSVLIYDDSVSATAESLATRLGIDRTLRWSDDDGLNSYEDAISAGEALPVIDDDASPEDPFVIIYTSGTTGTPKGVVHSHASVRANIDASVLSSGISSQSVCLTILPIFHVAGLNLYANAVLLHGGTAIIVRSFDAEHVLDLLLEPSLHVSHVCGVPANYQFMAALPRFSEEELPGTVVAIGGAPVPQALVEEWSSHNAKTIVVFGITEAGSTVITSTPGDSSLDASAIGTPAVGTSARIVDADGNRQPPGVVGELLISGPTISSGYWRNEDATRASRTADGWLRTGDAAVLDESGVIHLVDRWKDMYISGGENVYPAEVENTIYNHPSVSQVAVVGLPHEKWGETGVAFVVIREGSSVETAELREWCRARLAPYKVPTEFRLVESLPRNAMGKILKAELRALSRA